MEKEPGIDVKMQPVEYGVFRKEWRGGGNHRKGRTRGQMVFFTSSIKDTPEGALFHFYAPDRTGHMGHNQPELFELIDKIMIQRLIFRSGQSCRGAPGGNFPPLSAR